MAILGIMEQSGRDVAEKREKIWRADKESRRGKRTIRAEAGVMCS